MILEGDVSTERYVLPRRHVLQGKDCHGNPRVGAMGEPGWAQWTRGPIASQEEPGGWGHGLPIYSSHGLPYATDYAIKPITTESGSTELRCLFPRHRCGRGKFQW